MYVCERARRKWKEKAKEVDLLFGMASPSCWGGKTGGAWKRGGPMIQDPGRPAMEICLFQEAAAEPFLLVLVLQLL